MTLFIDWPLLALVPAAILAVFYHVYRNGFTLVTALLWAAYAAYEYGMHRRWLCTGECNIRVDLLMLYPLLLFMTSMAGTITARAVRRRRSKP